MPEENVDNQVFAEADTDDGLDSYIRNTPELAAAEAYGVDVRALIANSKRSVAERIERHKNALDSYQKFKGARLL